MNYSLCDDFLNAKKAIYPIAKYLSSYMDGKTDYAPWAVEIHPTAKCNHRCIHCSYKERNENRAELPHNIFDKLIDSLIKMKVKGVYFSGGGEPCSYAGLKDAIKRLKQGGAEVALVTNGTLFREMKVIEAANFINYIAVSVPSCDSARFKEITGQPFLERALSIPEEIKKRFVSDAPIIGARVVVTNLIVEEVPEILETLKEKQFDYALFKIVRDYEDRGLGVSEDMAQKLQKETELLKDAGKIDPKFTNLDKVFAYRKPYDPVGKCHINTMGLLAAVTPEGDVFPNISEIGKDEFKIGNLAENSLENLWNGFSHQKVKEHSNIHWQKGDCQNCRAISYNQYIENLISGIPKREDPFL